MPEGDLMHAGEARNITGLTELKERLLQGIAEVAGEGAVGQARLLLDYVQMVMVTDRIYDLKTFQDQVINRSVPFIQQSSDPTETHLRLMGVSHVLVNMLQPSVETTADEYITSRFEELRDRLFSLERVEEANPSLNNRLRSIYEGLVGLASALGLTSCDAFCL